MIHSKKPSVRGALGLYFFDDITCPRGRVLVRHALSNGI